MLNSSSKVVRCTLSGLVDRRVNSGDYYLYTETTEGVIIYLPRITYMRNALTQYKPAIRLSYIDFRALFHGTPFTRADYESA